MISVVKASDPLGPANYGVGCAALVRHSPYLPPVHFVFPNLGNSLFLCMPHALCLFHVHDADLCCYDVDVKLTLEGLLKSNLVDAVVYVLPAAGPQWCC